MKFNIHCLACDHFKKIGANTNVCNGCYQKDVLFVYDSEKVVARILDDLTYSHISKSRFMIGMTTIEKGHYQPTLDDCFDAVVFVK